MEEKDQSKLHKDLIAENTERLKELACINKTTKVVKTGKPIGETLQQICDYLPDAWQYPNYTVARIFFDGIEYKTKNFKLTQWVLRQEFTSIDGKIGRIEIYYLAEFSVLDEGPFLKEERELINNLAEIICGFINSTKGREMFSIESESSAEASQMISSDVSAKSFNKKLLQHFLNRHNSNRDIFHDLMPFKVKEILLVATLYDAYSIEKEGRFMEQMLGEHQQLNLTSMPRITGVSNLDEAFEQLNKKKYDLVIIMQGSDATKPIEISKNIKEKFNYLQIFLLLNSNNDLPLYLNNKHDLSFIDKIFVWNGDSSIFFTMVKLLEDRINVKNDTNIGMTGVILLVEDSIRYYSKYLPLLFNVIFEQTKSLIDEVSADEFAKIMKLRARPKVLLATNYEEAVYILEEFEGHIICLISDMEFQINGKKEKNAGETLVRKFRSEIPDLPTIIQSSDAENMHLAHALKVSFIDKNSISLSQEIRSFIDYYLGFGKFIYRNAKGREIAIAHTLRDFEKKLQIIPDESLEFHARRNHFSLWLMARGEIYLAKLLRSLKFADFKTVTALRDFLINTIQSFKHDKKRGKVVPFSESLINDESNILSLTSGALGGKGRGLSFVNNLIYDFNIEQYIEGINIKTPLTSIIGADEFSRFMSDNKLTDFVAVTNDYNAIKETFIKAKLTKSLSKVLRKILKKINTPIAVRSSGLFEDSLTQPFAGIFETYILPNNNPDIEIRLEQVTNAIKLVYASVYSEIATGYIRAVNYKVEEEKMAIVIQEVVGNQYDGTYYPHISGVAHSYNYYPVGYMKPEEGFAVAAIGLGKYVVEGERAFRFSPKYPDVKINSLKDQLNNSQLDFYAVNLSNNNPDLLKGEEAGLVKLEISEAEKHGNLKHCVSVFDIDNEILIPGIDSYGPRIVDFCNILKYNYIPLAEAIKVIIETVEEAIGAPVEIEFAVDLNKDKDNKASFYLLQIKPLIGNADDFQISDEDLSNENILIYSEKGMGNGLVENISDIIFIDNSKFDKLKTEDMAREISELNEKMVEEEKNYILIGPGRWGTRDRFIGIPVTWPQISNAKVIIETSLKNFPLDASLGSHFFHNVTSMGVGYLTVQPEQSKSYIKYDMLDKQKIVNKTKYFKHISLEKPVSVRMDGKKRIAVISCDDCNRKDENEEL